MKESFGEMIGGDENGTWDKIPPKTGRLVRDLYRC